MKYYIERLNRTVELDDDLVNEYCKYEKLRDQPFSIAVRTEYGCAPTEEQVSNEELSNFCNEVLLHELKIMTAMPKIMKTIKENYEKFNKASEENELLDLDIEVGD